MSEKTSLKYFFSGVNKLNAFVIPIIDFETEPMSLTDYDGPWIIEVHRSASDGNVSWTLEASTDKVNWTTFDVQAENLPIPCQLTQSQLRPNYFRLRFKISQGPTGTTTAFLGRVKQA